MGLVSTERLKADKIARYHQNGYLHDRLVAQNLLSLISVIIPLGMLLVYMATPHASDSSSGSLLIIISSVIIAVTSFRLLKNWNTPRGNAYQLFGAFIDFLAIAAILVGYALAYGLPLSSAGKSPTANIFFIYLASRIVLFQGPIMIKTGMMAIGTWIALVSLSLFEPQFMGRTSSYIEYLTSFKVLIGAEVERLLQFGFVTAILYAYIRTARHEPVTGFLRRPYFLQNLSKFLALTQRKRPENQHALIEIRTADISSSDNINSQTFKLLRNLPVFEQVKINKMGRLSTQSAGVWIECSPSIAPKLDEFIHTLHAQLTQTMIKTIGTETPNLIIGGCLLNKGSTSEALLSFTDIAIKDAINEGKTSRLFDAEMRTKIEQELQIERTIKLGLKNNLFEVFYQPIMDMMTEKPVGFEALIRLRDKNGNYISPDRFIPTAEKNGLINNIMDSLCDQVANDAGQFTDIFEGQMRKPYININVAPIQLKDMKHTIQALERARKGGLTINAEITESSVLNAQQAHQQIEGLLKAGFSLAIDDFGTGYSSIERLKELNFSTLKIDKTFVDKIEDPESYAFLAAIVNLARTTSNTVILEGVETLQQKLLIMQMGVRLCQGYYYSAPMNMDSMRIYLEQQFDIKKPLQKRAGHISSF